MGFFPVLISRFIYQRLQFFNPCQIGLLTLLYLMRDFVGRQVSRKCVDNAVIKFNLCNDLANLPQVILLQQGPFFYPHIWRKWDKEVIGIGKVL